MGLKHAINDANSAENDDDDARTIPTSPETRMMTTMMTKMTTMTTAKKMGKLMTTPTRMNMGMTVKIMKTKSEVAMTMMTMHNG